MQTHKAGRQRQHAPVAESRQHRENREIVEVHFDLPGMSAECEHQQRGLPNQRNGDAESNRRDRPSGVGQRNGDDCESRAGNRIRDDVPPKHGADRGQHWHVHDAEPRQYLRECQLERSQIAHSASAFFRNEAGRQPARTCGSTTRRAEPASRVCNVIRLLRYDDGNKIEAAKPHKSHAGTDRSDHCLICRRPRRIDHRDAGVRFGRQQADAQNCAKTHNCQDCDQR